MKHSLQRLLGTCVTAGVLGMAVAGQVAIAAEHQKAGPTPAIGNPSVSAPAQTEKYVKPASGDAGSMAARIEEGRKIAFDRSKGNCLACHALPGGDMAGNIGPALPYAGISMKKRFPKREALHAQVYNAMQNNPNTVMPPFGLHRILTEDELEKVVDYIWSL